MDQDVKNQISQIIQNSIRNGEFVRMTLGKPTSQAGNLKNVMFRPVMIRNSQSFSATFRFETKDEVKNFSLEEVLAKIEELLGTSFLSVHVFSTVADYQLILNKKRKGEIRQSKPTFTQAGPVFHDVKTKRLINTEGNVYLQKLGVTNKDGQVLHQMGDKYRQINKYVEIFEELITRLNTGDIHHIYDMGCGKGYLTFGLYDHLHNELGLEVSITGVEMRPELVNFCNSLACEIGFEHLNYEVGDINDAEIKAGSVLIALHACDTATDDAIAKGIKAGSPLIVCAPCCQKQVRKDMKPPDKWNSIFRHGILFERQAEILTDVIRSLMMQKYGYDTSVFEFISPEHTAKNLMIAGVKGKVKNMELIDREISEIKQEFGISRHYLEELLEK